LQIGVEDFGFAMDATPKQKENFAKIRSQIIEPAIRELTAKDGWLIDWKQIKAGRRVVSVRFDFKRNPQGSLPL
jgi:plasmid replication initiation protein